jgi:hypothetical protein
MCPIPERLSAEPLVAGKSDVQKHLRRADAFLLEAAGRLRPDIRFEEARAQLESIWPAIRGVLAPSNLPPAERSRILGLHMKVEPGEKGISVLRKQFSKPLYVLLAISGAACGLRESRNPDALAGRGAQP